MGNEYTNAPIELTGGSPSTILIDSLDLPFGADASDNGSGSQYAQSIAVTSVLPTASFSTRDLEAVFDNIGLTGQCVGSGKAITAFGYYLRNLENCNSGSLSHLKYTSGKGLLRLGALSASRGEDATISVAYDALSDGSNAPVQLATGATLPTSPSGRRYTLGSVTIDGTSFVEVDSISLDFGVSTTTKRPALASMWAESIGVSTIRPVLTLSGRELEKVTNTVLTNGGIEAQHIDTTIELVERDTPAGYYADAATTHISLTLYGVWVPDTVVSASGGGEATHTARLIAGDDGSSAPVVITTGTAI